MLEFEMVNFLKAESGILVGEFELSPIQQWFFEQNFLNINHYNQAVMFESSIRISFSILKTVFTVISKYHDVFRIECSKHQDRYIQKYTKESRIKLSEVILSATNRETLLKEMQIHTETVQKSLHIDTGPIVYVVLYKCHDMDRIFIVAHHLIIDGVSWRILLDDIETIYKLLLNKEAIILPAKTHSFRQWIQASIDSLSAKGILQEIGYWSNVINKAQAIPIVQNRTSKTGYNTVNLSLSEEETNALIFKIPKKYNTQINDILITSLVLAVGDISEQYELAFTLEGHGREPLIELDVSHTIGWFTSMFPVYIKLEDPKSIVSSINNVKKALSVIPNKGIGYGIIKYYSDKLNGSLPKIGFNYLGQFEVNEKNKIFSYSTNIVGTPFDPCNDYYNLIDINCIVKRSVFNIDFGYKLSYYSEETMQEFANSFKKRLLSIIREC